MKATPVCSGNVGKWEVMIKSRELKALTVKERRKRLRQLVPHLPEMRKPGFFDDYPRFQETSSVAAALDRLNFRQLHMIERNRALLEGKRVLDIASHDSRFSFAALKAGAAHVTGIEARESLVGSGVDNLKHYGIAPDRYDMRVGDVFEEISNVENIDTVMCVGFLYHTARHYELFAAISKLGAKNLIIDSRVLTDEAPLIRLKFEGTRKEGRIWDKDRNRALSSTPSASALQMLMTEFGYEVEILGLTVQPPLSTHKYATRERVTMTGRR